MLGNQIGHRERTVGIDSVPLERRASLRVCTVYFVAKISREADAGLFRVRNISDIGMMFIAHVRFSAGERIRAELADNFIVEGTVVWVTEFRCGVSFDRPISSTSVLRARADQKLDPRGGALRLQVSRKATCYSEKGIRAVTITDVSRRGVGIAHDGSMQLGMSVRLVLEGGTARTGVVCWSNGTSAGLRLTEPLTYQELESAGRL